MGVRSTKENFNAKSLIIHGDKFNYSLVEYGGYDNKVKII